MSGVNLECGGHYEGEGVWINRKKAFYWYEKAAEQGNSVAQFQCGLMCFNGDGTQKDDKKALYWLEKAGKQGHVEAQYHCGRLYFESRFPDIAKSKMWMETARKNGHKEAIKFLKTHFS